MARPPSSWTPAPGELVHVYVRRRGLRPFSRVYRFQRVRPQKDVPKKYYGDAAGWDMVPADGSLGALCCWNLARETYPLSAEEEALWRLTGELPKRG